MRYQITTVTISIALAVAVAAKPPASKMENTDPKFSCSLSPEQLQNQRQKLIPGLLERADQVSDLSKNDGLRLHFEQRPGLLAELVRIIEREQDCCSFLRFNIAVEPAAGGVTFDISGPVGTRDMLKAL